MNQLPQAAETVAQPVDSFEPRSNALEIDHQEIAMETAPKDEQIVVMRDEEEEVVYEEVKVECQQVSKDPVVAEVEQIFEDSKEEEAAEIQPKKDEFAMEEEDEVVNPDLFTEHLPLIGRIPMSKYCSKLLKIMICSVFLAKRPGVKGTEAKD